MELNGRKIEVYRKLGVPRLIFIDVMQKEGDCLKGYAIPERLKCQFDCENSFLTFAYDIVERTILFEGALLKNRSQWFYDTDAMLKNGFDPNAMSAEDFVKENFDAAVFKKTENLESLLIDGEQICFKPACGFEVANKLSFNDPEMKSYQGLIRNFTKEVLKKGGFEFHGPSDFMITYKYKENIRG